ncbi:conserved protein of unknown function [Paraburkholderia dioscoreae]|jgi:hypothetical protein|uniref:DUF2591 domain-containing protein n=2 Tax=Paraburkholderia dioscoreae TaxID=2604047 RepID=A0A5Q4ZMH0_9BURK|nr:conserved protein of unknown function [Paraburkholderia dioscoreae]
MDAMSLKGAQLDYWVACAERQNGHAESDAIPTPPPAFSSDRALADAIIDREGIVVVLAVDAEFGNQYIAGAGPANAYGFPNASDGLWMGDGRLEAAMRCYVDRTFTPQRATD